MSTLIQILSVQNKQAVATNTLFFLLGCRHPFNILENQHVKKGYMEFYFKKGIVQD